MFFHRNVNIIEWKLTRDFGGLARSQLSTDSSPTVVMITMVRANAMRSALVLTHLIFIVFSSCLKLLPAVANRISVCFVSSLRRSDFPFTEAPVLA
jgi:hypothetical protein